MKFNKLIPIITIPLILFGCECKTHSVKCVILAHNTSSDKAGNITYNTIIKREDGVLQNAHGMVFYVKEIGETTYIADTKCQWTLFK
jgi:hypothetical protein